ncbi:MAG: hypothetical protein ACK5NK_14730 [Niabella sp.]
MEKTLSGLLASLSKNAKQLEDEYASYRLKTQQEIENLTEDFKKNLEWERAAWDTRSDVLQAELQSQWDRIKSEWEAWKATGKGYTKKVGDVISGGIADKNAELSEANAEMAVSFALSAIDNAADSVVDAIKARNKAENLKKK